MRNLHSLYIAMKYCTHTAVRLSHIIIMTPLGQCSVHITSLGINTQPCKSHIDGQSLFSELAPICGFRGQNANHENKVTAKKKPGVYSIYIYIYLCFYILIFIHFSIGQTRIVIINEDGKKVERQVCSLNCKLALGQQPKKVCIRCKLRFHYVCTPTGIRDKLPFICGVS